MKNEKDIGKLIAERLSHSEVGQPNNLMWKTVEKTLMRRRLIRIGLVLISIIVALTSFSYFLILPAIYEKNNEKTTVPKAFKVTKESSLDRNHVNPNLFEDSISNQNLIQKDASYHKPFFKQTNKPRKNLKAEDGQEDLSERKFAETSVNPMGKSNSNEKYSTYVSKKLGELDLYQKANDLSMTRTNSQDFNEGSKETTDVVQQGNPKIAKKPWSFKDAMATKQGKEKKDGHPNPIAESDSLMSRHIDSLPLRKLNKISKTDSKLKKNAIDSIAKKKKSNLQYYFLPLANASLYSRLKDNSTIDRALDENKKTSNLRFGFGGYGLVRLNPKFEIRLGILYSNYSKKTFNVNVIPNNGNTNYYTNVNFKNGLDYEGFSNSFSQPSQITLEEELAYLEFPIDFGYSMWKKNKWTVNLIAGASAAILMENRLNALTESDGLVFLGENGNYTKNVLSLRLGTGIPLQF